MLCSDTPFLIEKHVSRTGIRDGGCGSCSDTPFREQKPVSRARRGRKRRTEATPHCTTRYDHPTKPQNHKTTTHHTTSYHIIPHHIISYHIISQPYPNSTTPPTDKTHPIHHSPTHNKKLLPQNRRKSFINLSANRLSQQSFEATRAPKRGQRHRGWRRLTP